MNNKTDWIYLKFVLIVKLQQACFHGILFLQNILGERIIVDNIFRVIVARLDGSIDFLELETFQDPKASTPLSPSSLNRKIKGKIYQLITTHMI